jgi:alkanesulfonate monooxygenase SsuD/methylene tetrahydromethanopterin reductase-like flavin-dependent oxidoreductase (luciferase family)
VLRALQDGDAVDHRGEFFSLEAARILPPPKPAIPLLIGGGGEAAVRRTARFGDGWLGIFCSARRFAQTREQIIAAAAETGRPAPSWFGLSVWCGLDADPGRARAELGERMQSLYRLPPEKFQHITAAGTPEQVAERLSTYIEAGATSITIVPAAQSVEAGIEAVAEVRRLLI